MFHGKYAISIEKMCIFNIFYSCKGLLSVFYFTVFFVTLPSEMANLLRLGIKEIKNFCSALDFL